jgi:hypothetical protein
MSKATTIVLATVGVSAVLSTALVVGLALS